MRHVTSLVATDMPYPFYCLKSGGYLIIKQKKSVYLGGCGKRLPQSGKGWRKNAM